MSPGVSLICRVVVVAPEEAWARRGGGKEQHHQAPALIQEGTAGTELGKPRPAGQAARGIALEMALAVPRATLPWLLGHGATLCPLHHPSTPLPAGGCTAAREEALPSAPPLITAAALSQALLRERAAWPPMALIYLGRWPLLG